jgi:hypothetical protein
MKEEKNVGMVLGDKIIEIWKASPRRYFSDRFIWVDAGENKMLKLPFMEIKKLFRGKKFHSEMKRKWKHLSLVEEE